MPEEEIIEPVKMDISKDIDFTKEIITEDDLDGTNIYLLMLKTLKQIEINTRK